MLKLYKLLAIFALSLVAACTPSWEDEMIINPGNSGGNNGSRVETENQRKVLLLYSAGYNSLKDYLRSDFEDLKGGWLPGNNSTDDVVLVYTHTPVNNGYKKPSSPYLIRIYKDREGTTISDTLVTYAEGTISSSKEQLNTVLNYVKSKFSAGSYGMIFSSHATGYLPAGFYTNPNSYVFSKSIGQDRVDSSGSSMSYEIDLPDFVDAIPMKLDYILFDACLMGGVEVAYELREKCDKVGFSQAEVLAEGFNYSSLTQHLIQNDEPNPQAVCEDYFEQYDKQSGVYRSATISLVDCRQLESLAELCKEIFASHREGLDNITPSKVQRFYRSNYHWFYDLESIIINAGASDAELSKLNSILEECILYKGSTPEFMQEFKIDIFSGLSMYLPCKGNNELDKFYKTLEWNKATGLVE